MPHPQMPPLSPQEIESFLTKAPLVTLCTHNKDGTIHAAPTWFRYEDDKIAIGTQEAARRVKNIKQDPNVTAVFDQEQAPYKGIVAYGRAELDNVDVIPKRVRIFEKYMPTSNAEYLAKALPGLLGKPIIITVKPNKIVSYDYAKDPTGLFK